MQPDTQILQNSLWLILILVLWTLPWKGAALWRAAKNNQKMWFLTIFIFNTLGILEIVYLFIFSKKKKKEEKQEIFHTTLKF